MRQQNTMPDQPVPDFLRHLNPPQLKAVQTTQGPVLILAGAGTGKTNALTHRIANIIMNEEVTASQVLAVTFTNKAAGEMKERVAAILQTDVSGLWIGTFHSICARILRRHAHHFGFGDNFTIIDPDDQIRLLKQIIKDHNLDEKEYPAKKLAYIINKWKDRGLTPKSLRPSDHVDFAQGKAHELFAEYQQRLQVLNAMDFGDLLVFCIRLFNEFPDVLAQYHDQFQYIHVDEYQDTNIAQYLWLRLLAQGNHNLCCVGDEDQSIYGWRGAEIGNILKFEKDFPGATVIRLEQNYRSTSRILAAASALIENNNERLGKTLWTEDNEGEKVHVTSLYNDRQEARYVANSMTRLQQYEHVMPKEMAVLVRAGYQTRAFEECFLNEAIPYRIVGGLRFYERMEIRDAIAYIRAAKNKDGLAFERIINTPRRGIGPNTIQSLMSYARERQINPIEGVKQLVAGTVLRPKVKETLAKFVEQLDHWAELLEQESLPDAVKKILDESGYTGMWESERSIEAQGRLENLQELLRALEDFDSVENFLEHVSLVTDANETVDDNVITVMTLHAAKGLEFDVVFLPGWEEGLFPSQRSLEGSGSKGLEEERRLAYVGITRAKKRAYISMAGQRRVYQRVQTCKPSRFIGELPVDLIEIHDSAGVLAPQFADDDDDIAFGDNNDWGYTSGQNHFKQNPRYKKSAYTKKSDSYNASAPSNTNAANITPPPPVSTFRVGERIFHPKFGYGIILGIECDELDIAFETTSRKRVIDRYVKKP